MQRPRVLLFLHAVLLGSIWVRALHHDLGQGSVLATLGHLDRLLGSNEALLHLLTVGLLDTAYEYLVQITASKIRIVLISLRDALALAADRGDHPSVGVARPSGHNHAVGLLHLACSP